MTVRIGQARPQEHEVHPPTNHLLGRLGRAGDKIIRSLELKQKKTVSMAPHGGRGSGALYCAGSRSARAARRDIGGCWRPAPPSRARCASSPAGRKLREPSASTTVLRAAARGWSSHIARRTLRGRRRCGTRGRGWRVRLAHASRGRVSCSARCISASCSLIFFTGCASGNPISQYPGDVGARSHCARCRDTAWPRQRQHTQAMHYSSNRTRTGRAWVTTGVAATSSIEEP